MPDIAGNDPNTPGQLNSFSVIIPVFNEEKIIGTTLEKLISTCVETKREYEIIVIDDGSTDNTLEELNKFNVTIFQHPYNIGNGAAIKRGIRAASKDITIMMDGDGQHDPKYIKDLLHIVDTYDMVVGARTSESETAWHRNMANKIYNLVATYVCGRKIEDLTSGFRAIRTKIAKQFVYLLPNTFSYPTTLTLSLVKAGYSLAYHPIEVKKRVGKSKIKIIRDGLRFFVIILRITVFFAPLKVFIPISSVLFTGGFVWYIIQYIARGALPLGSILLFITSILIFVFALLSEQISYLRYQK